MSNEAAKTFDQINKSLGLSGTAHLVEKENAEFFGKIEGKLVRMVRGSEVSDFQRCRFRWNLRWNKGYVAMYPDGKLFAGNLMHKHNEVWFKTKDSIEAESAMHDLYQDSPDQSFEAQELLTLVKEIAVNYREQWSEADRDILVIASEFTFAVPITDDLYYTGTIDLLFNDAEGFLYFKDYKLTNSIEKYQKKAAMDQQISRYWWALDALANGHGYVQVTEQLLNNDVVCSETKTWIPVSDWEAAHDIHLSSPHGFIYDVILRDLPKAPEPLKAGGLSVNKAQKTTYDIYLAELRLHGLAGYNADDVLWVNEKYHDILAHLKAQETDFGNRFFQRFPVTRNREELQIAMNEFLSTATEMWNVEKRASFFEEHNVAMASYNPIYRHNTDDCTWDCQFLSYCAASMKGSDSEYLLNIGYEQQPVTNYANESDFPQERVEL